MPITPNMTITTPSVSVTAGPDWATILNAAFSTVDTHDHSDGKGVKITPLGLNINSDLSIGSQNLTTVNSMRMVSLGAALAGVNDIRALYSVNGDLYYNNGGGAQIQLTSGGSPTAASDGTSRRFETQGIAANTTINPASTYSFIEVDTTTSVTLTLPAANAVSAGRFYEVKDVTGLAATNNIIIQRAGADTIDGGTSFTINLNYGGIQLVSNGVDAWSMVRPVVDTDQLRNLAVTTAKIADGAVTQAKRAALGQQLSASCGNFSTSSTSLVDVTNLSVTITTTGRAVLIMLVNEGTVNGNTIQYNGANAGGITVVRDSTSIGNGFLNFSGQIPASGITYYDEPAAGTYTYKVQASVLTSGTVNVNRLKLLVYEL